MTRLYRSALLGTLAAALVGGAAVQGAKADLIRTVPFSVGGTGSATVALPEFNPAHGTLNFVTVTETAEDQFVLEIFNSGTGGTYTAMAQNDFAFSLGGPPEQPGYLSATGRIPAGNPIFITMPRPVAIGTLGLAFPPDADAMFVGTGTLDTSVSLSAATVTSFSGATVNGLLAFAGAIGTVKVDYAFTPSAVPEPGSGVLMVSALGLFAGAVRRRGAGG